MSSDQHITLEQATSVKRQLQDTYSVVDEMGPREKLMKKAEQFFHGLCGVESKSFSPWSWAEVSARYDMEGVGFSIVDNLGLELPTLELGTLESIQKEVAIRNLVLPMPQNEIMCRELFSCILFNVLAEFKGQAVLVKEFEIKAGPSVSFGKVDYLVMSRQTKKHFLVVEAKQNDLLLGIAQVIMQVEALMENDSNCSEIFAVSTTWSETVFLKYSRLEHRSSPSSPVGQAFQSQTISGHDDLKLLSSMTKAAIVAALKVSP